MATCPNCKKALSCGCQKRKASDGSVVCTNCISAYEKGGAKISSARAVYQAPPPPPTVWTPEQLEAATNKWSTFKNKLNK